MKKCPYCGRPNDDAAELCAYCKAGIPHEGKTDEKEDDKKEDESYRSRKR